MMRGVLVFAFFAFATVLVIILQPGPRAYDNSAQVSPNNHAASRNDVSVLPEPDVASRLSATSPAVPQVAQPSAAVPRPAGSLDRLNAALNASLGRLQADQGIALARTAVPKKAPMVTAVAPRSDVAPDLRDMSWQTLSALSQLGNGARAPGQKGSLLQSIVRRSMTAVDGTQPSAMPATNVSATVSPNAKPLLTAQQGTYTVSSGDTLALIAVKLYGSAQATDTLLSMNPVLRQNPNNLRIGQVLAYAVQ